MFEFVKATGVLLIAAAVPAAVADDDLSEALVKCRALGDTAERLACYDALAPHSAAAPANASTPDAKPAAAPPSVADPVTVDEPEPPAEPLPEDMDDRFGREQVSDAVPDVLVSRIIGDYDGWTGNTVFRLENGQEWVQAEAGRWRHRGPPNPEVTIRRRAFGSYRLQVEGSNKTIRVKRRK